MDLKNKLTEEEIDLIVDIIAPMTVSPAWRETAKFNLKQASGIHKSAREATDEYIASMSHAQADIIGHSWKRLEQLRAAERAERNMLQQIEADKKWRDKMIYCCLFKNGIYLFPQVTTGFFKWPWMFVFQIRFLIFDIGIHIYSKRKIPRAGVID